jgi:hypothetical protein
MQGILQRRASRKKQDQSANEAPQASAERRMREGGAQKGRESAAGHEVQEALCVGKGYCVDGQFLSRAEVEARIAEAQRRLDELAELRKADQLKLYSQLGERQWQRKRNPFPKDLLADWFMDSTGPNMSAKETGMCVNPRHGVATKQRARGLCSSCYIVANKLVNEGKTTWAKLEAAGKALPDVEKKRQKIADWFLE